MKLSKRLDRATFLIADSLRSHADGEISSFDVGCIKEYIFVLEVLLDMRRVTEKARRINEKI